MSKPVRIRDDVAMQVEVKASAEHRSFANMVEVLLLAALTEREVVRADGAGSGLRQGGAGIGPAAAIAPVSRSVSADVAAKVPGVSVGVRAHMRGDRPTLECSERVASGVCPKCGRSL